MFVRIVNVMEEVDDYFKLRKDCCEQLFFSHLQNCTTALRMLDYDKAANAIDVEIQMGETTCVRTKVKFACIMVKVFVPKSIKWIPVCFVKGGCYK